MDTTFLQEFNKILISAFPEIMVSLGSNGHWSDGVDNISLVYAENGNFITSIMVTLLEIWGRGIFVDYRFSVPKFLDILKKRKKDYISLHPEEKQAVEMEFEKLHKMLLQKWTSP